MSAFDDDYIAQLIARSYSGYGGGSSSSISAVDSVTTRFIFVNQIIRIQFLVFRYTLFSAEAERLLSR
jgi:hypothetical protein